MHAHDTVFLLSMNALQRCPVRACLSIKSNNMHVEQNLFSTCAMHYKVFVVAYSITVCSHHAAFHLPFVPV